jgi:hypothetical protein
VVAEIAGGGEEMKFILSHHAKEEMQRRQIPPDLLESVLHLRAVVNDMLVPSIVIIVYRTSQINRYWRAE